MPASSGEPNNDQTKVLTNFVSLMGQVGIGNQPLPVNPVGTVGAVASNLQQGAPASQGAPPAALSRSTSLLGASSIQPNSQPGLYQVPPGNPVQAQGPPGTPMQAPQQLNTYPSHASQGPPGNYQSTIVGQAMSGNYQGPPGNPQAIPPQQSSQAGSSQGLPESSGAPGYTRKKPDDLDLNAVHPGLLTPREYLMAVVST